MPAKKQEKTFEEAMARLEEIVSLMEAETALERSLKLYEEGVQLTAYCNRILDGYTAKIEMLEQKEDGIREVPFSNKEEA